MRLSAQEIYDRLLNVDHILELEGQIKFFLGDVNIITLTNEKNHLFNAAEYAKYEAEVTSIFTQF